MARYVAIVKTKDDTFIIPKDMFWDEHNAFGGLVEWLQDKPQELDIKLYSTFDPENAFSEFKFTVTNAVEDVLLLMRKLNEEQMDYEIEEQAKNLVRATQ